MKNSSANKNNFTLVSTGQSVPAPETQETKARKLFQERIDLQYLEHNLQTYAEVIAGFEMILKGTIYLRVNNFDVSRWAGMKIPMVNGNNFTHTFDKDPIDEIKNWAERWRGRSPKMLDAPSKSIKDPEALKESIRQISEKAALGVFLSCARGHYLKQIKQSFPGSTGILFDLAQYRIEDAAKALGMDAQEIKTLQNSAYTDMDYAALYIGDAMSSLKNHKGVWKHLHREIDLRRNLMEAQNACLSAGLRPD